MISLPLVMVLAVALSYIGVGVFRAWAEKRGILDLPNARSSHCAPTPRGGGIVIVLVTLAGLWGLAAGIGAPRPWSVLLAYVAGSLVVAAAGWLDDLYSIPRWLRLAAQITGALLALAPAGLWRDQGWPAAGFSLLWVVGLTNAFNFMDGIDGIAACQAITAGLGWGLLSFQVGEPFVAAFGFLLAACSLGFLCHNWSPARVFMGDVGSLFLGFTFAMIPFLLSGLGPKLSGLGLACSAVALMWPFVFDASFTFLRRLVRGENVFDAHCSHLYQRLVHAGWRHPAVTILYAALGLGGVIITRPWSQGFVGGEVNGMLALLPLCLALWVTVIVVERQPPPSATDGNA